MGKVLSTHKFYQLKPYRRGQQASKRFALSGVQLFLQMFPVKYKENIFQWKNYEKLSSPALQKTKQMQSKLQLATIPKAKV